MLYVILIILYLIASTSCAQQQKPLTTLPTIKPLPFTEPWLHLLEQYYNLFHRENNNDISLREQCAYSLPDFNCQPFIYNDGISDDKRDAYHIRPQVSLAHIYKKRKYFTDSNIYILKYTGYKISYRLR